MSGIKTLVGKKMTKKVKFCDSDVTITKLSVAEVLEIQEVVKSLGEENETGGIELLKKVISSAVEGGSDLTDEDFKSFPMDELSRLSNEVMKFSGIGADAGK